jgi:hypothetical protein
MARKPNLASVLDDLPEPIRTQPQVRSSGPAKEKPSPATVLVGANLPPSYARNLALLHAETGLTKKELLQEALDLLFVQKGGRSLTRG